MLTSFWGFIYKDEILSNMLPLDFFLKIKFDRAFIFKTMLKTESERLRGKWERNRTCAQTTLSLHLSLFFSFSTSVFLSILLTDMRIVYLCHLSMSFTFFISGSVSSSSYRLQRMILVGSKTTSMNTNGFATTVAGS